MRQRCIPPGWHYVSAQQSELWRELAAAHSPASEESVLAAYAEMFARVAAESAGKALHLITLGAGSGEKERELVSLLRAAGCSLRITAVDISESLARETADKLSAGGVTNAQAVVGDFRVIDIEQFDDEAGPRLFTAFGLSPNTKPGEFFHAISRLLGHGDQAMISANLWPKGQAAEAEVLAQYDNPQTRRWLGRLFREWGLPDEACPALDFSIGEIEGIAAVIAATEWPEKCATQFAQLPAAVGEWSEGDSVDVFFSLRYTMELFSKHARDHGLSVRRRSASGCGREGVFWLGA